MTRLCFIGNSHIGALKLAWEQLREAPEQAGTDAVFFGSHKDGLADTRIEDGVLLPGNDTLRENFLWTSGGLSEIRLADYDHFFIAAGHTIWNLRHFATGAMFPALSTELVQEIIRNWQDSWMIRLAQGIADVTGGERVTFIGQPLPSEEAPVNAKLLGTVDNDADGIQIARARALQDQIGAFLARGDTGLTVRVLTPPAEALGRHGLYTRHEFSRGSVRLSRDMDIPHQAEEYSHMNADYGRLVLRDLLAA